MCIRDSLDPEQGILFVNDGAKALRKAIRDVFASRAPVHRCHRHKERNVVEHLPERDRSAIQGRLRAAWALGDHGLAQSHLEVLAAELDGSWPDAARSLHEGLAETLTLMRLGISGQLAKTLCSTDENVKGVRSCGAGFGSGVGRAGCLRGRRSAPVTSFSGGPP